jgi:hypothetical protein
MSAGALFLFFSARWFRLICDTVIAKPQITFFLLGRGGTWPHKDNATAKRGDAVAKT